jgi:lipopolysaccharide export system protein LptA
MSSAFFRGLVLLALLPVAALAQAKAPSGRCAFDVKAERQGRLIKLPSGQMNAFTAGNVVATCKAQGLVLRSDSLESYGDEGRIVFIGHVDYSEPRLKLKSDQLTYFQREERILATSNVDARLPSGSTIRGPQLEFLRAIPKVRTQQATATSRPTISLVEKDAQGKPQPPVHITGNTVWMQGDTVVSSSGNVIVVRPELTATGDSLYADAGSGLLRIMRQPKITGTRGRPFTLIGETIDLLTKRKKLDRVLSKNAAEAQSEDLTLKSDSIDLRVVDDLLQRAVAWGKSRAHATSQTQSIVADSIDVLMPGQRVREMRALRLASAEGAPDTVKFRTKEKDRLTGDTIIAHFDTAATKDTTKKPQMRDLVATGIPNSPATSLQHLPPRDTSLCIPAINYVRGRVIRVTFVAGKIDTVKVTDPDVGGGVYIEPKPDSSAHGCRAALAAKAAADQAPILSAPAGGATGDPRKQAPASPPSGPPPAVPPVTATPAPVPVTKRP